MNRIFCIGNGESRKGFDLEKLRPYGKIYGCNALYRDFKPDVLIAVDHGIMHEIYNSGYAYDNECWFRQWQKRRAVEYKTALWGVGCNIPENELKSVREYFTKLNENEKGDSEHFVLHGTPLKNVLKYLDSDLKSLKNKTITDEFKRFASKHNLNISWIRKKGDKVNRIDDIMPNNRDVGWSSGSTSGYIACLKEKPNEVYLIGQDMTSNTNTINNLYKGTDNYARVDNKPTPGVNWINQWKKLFQIYPNTKFFKVNQSNDDQKVNQKIKEWKGIKNLIYKTYDECIFNR